MLHQPKEASNANSIGGKTTGRLFSYSSLAAKMTGVSKEILKKRYESLILWRIKSVTLWSVLFNYFLEIYNFDQNLLRP